MISLILSLLLFSAHAQSGIDGGQYYGFLEDPSQLGVAALQPHDPYFARMRPDAIKAPHGHFQHLAPADPGDDFPYAEFKAFEDAEVAAGRPPLLVTATWLGKKRPVYFSWSLGLDAFGRPKAPPSQWARAVNLRSDRYIQFFADRYVRGTLWQPAYPNYWVMVDNCSFRYDLYGVLDDSGIFRENVTWDPPFAATEREFIDSVVHFFRRLKQVAPDIHIMGNEGSLTDEADYPTIWAGFDGSVREDINDGFGSSATSRHHVLTFYRRYQFLAGAGKLAILRSLLPKPDAHDFADKLRTGLLTYLIFQADNFFWGPRFDDGSARGVPPEAYAAMREQLGIATGPPADQPFSDEYFRLYSRPCQGGIVFLNYSGKTLQVPLPDGYFDRAGKPAATLTIPDMQGDYALKAPGPRAARPRILPALTGKLSGPVRVTVVAPKGSTAHCTLDGSEPRDSSPACPDAIELESGMRLRAKAFAPGTLGSFTMSPAFEVQAQPPQVSACGATPAYFLLCLSNPSGQPVTMPWAIAGEAAQSPVVFQPGEVFQRIPMPALNSKVTLGKPSGASLRKNGAVLRPAAWLTRP